MQKNKNLENAILTKERSALCAVRRHASMIRIYKKTMLSQIWPRDARYIS